MRKNRCLRIDDQTWSDWKAEAKSAGLSLVELIRDRMKNPEEPHMQPVPVANAHMQDKKVVHTQGFTPGKTKINLPDPPERKPQYDVMCRAQGHETWFGRAPEVWCSRCGRQFCPDPLEGVQG